MQIWDAIDAETWNIRPRLLWAYRSTADVTMDNRNSDKWMIWQLEYMKKANFVALLKANTDLLKIVHSRLKFLPAILRVFYVRYQRAF